MRDEIRFGTDGWRAVIAERFTFENVRLVAGAIAAACHRLPEVMEIPAGIDTNRLIVGYDRRFLSHEFAREVAFTLSRAGIDVLLSDSPTPSQVVSFAVKHKKFLGGVIVTASHNPAAYNGIKFKAWYGGSALPEIYSLISEAIGGDPQPRGGGSVAEADIISDYVQAIRNAIDLDLIRNAEVRILHDPIHGAASGFPKRVFGRRRFPIIDTIRGEVNPSFGGVNPEPIPENLEASSERMRRAGGRYHLAICNDGDADRLGVLDEKGDFVSPHKILSLLALYLVRYRGVQGEVVKTFSTTRLIEKIASTLGVKLHETPIGFKYIADLMLTRDIAIGGEESGGIALGSFLPERDGVLSGLLVAEVIAAYRKPLSEIIAEMEEEFGALHYDRRDLYRSESACEAFIERVRTGGLDVAFHLGVASREEKDGIKLNLVDGSWILFRKSGTEPMIRIYCESPSREHVQTMLDVAMTELDR